MKQKNKEWDREKKIRRVEKGTDKATKYKKNVYQYGADEQDLDDDYDDMFDDVNDEDLPKK